MTGANLTQEIYKLWQEADKSYQELNDRFLSGQSLGPTYGIRFLSSELLEVEEYRKQLCLLHADLTKRGNWGNEEEYVRSVVKFLELRILRGDWQSIRPSLLDNAVQQIISMAHCKLIIRLREVLSK